MSAIKRKFTRRSFILNRHTFRVCPLNTAIARMQERAPFTKAVQRCDGCQQFVQFTSPVVGKSWALQRLRS
ncbi:hypothetical protein AALO_G00188170 [Alosa alosa]|uniref:Uncharacterized protein n=1 Tax=Alosa alosa TaxID=278164 RepID=A0AAV6GBI1_9TELE|nr:hypothetical protein AALO_G00188170 [Alosa alosa]